MLLLILIDWLTSKFIWNFNLDGRYFSGNSVSLNATLQIASMNSRNDISMCLSKSSSLTWVIMDTLNNEPISPEPIDLPSKIPDHEIMRLNSSRLINLVFPGLQYFPEYI
jgi:hypothetical protein